MTPLGSAILYLDNIMNRFTGKTAVVLVSDGRVNQGKEPLKAARTISAEYTNICFDIISFADDEKGRQTLETISGVNNCAFADGRQLLSDAVALDNFVSEVFYAEVSEQEPLQVLPPPEAEPVTPLVITLRGIHFDFDKSEVKAGVCSCGRRRIF